MTIYFITDVLPWIISAITIYSAFLAGDNKPSAWSIALFNQVLWFIYIFITKQWGLMPMNIALTVVFVRNYYKCVKVNNRYV